MSDRTKIASSPWWVEREPFITTNQRMTNKAGHRRTFLRGKGTEGIGRENCLESKFL